MKDLNLMFNVENPAVYHIVEAGRSIDISVPGTYNIVPINLDKIVAGHAAPLAKSEPQSLLSIARTENENTVIQQIATHNPEPLFTKNLSDLLYLTRTQ